MIKHIVMWKVPDNRKKEKIETIKSSLEGLPPKISEIKFLEVGINFTDSPRAFDVVLTTHFNSNDDLETYRVHPEHQKVVKIITDIVEKAVVVDYEI